MKSQGKQERSRRTIQNILDAALQVLIDEGFERSTTNRIADKAGYSVGTLYQYFEDKDDIYGKIVDQALLKMTDSAEALEAKPSLMETLQALFESVLASMEADPAIIQAVESLLNGRFREKRQAAYEALVASTLRLLRAHRREITVDDLELAASIIVAATSGLANSNSAQMLESPKFLSHVLRLQFAYLTVDS